MLGNPGKQRGRVVGDRRIEEKGRAAKTAIHVAEPTWIELTLQQLAAEMVAEDLKEAQRIALLKAHGHNVSVSLEH